MTTILTKKKDTTGAPAPGDLTNAAGGAELAVNTADKRLYTKDSGGNVVEIGTNPTILNIDNIQIDGNTISSTNTNGNINLTPNGTGSVVVSKLQVTGTFQLDGNVTVGDSSADTLTINSTITSNLRFTDNTYDIGASGATRPRTGYFGTSVITPALTVSGLTSGRVTYASTGGALTDSANLTYDGTALNIGGGSSTSLKANLAQGISDSNFQLQARNGDSGTAAGTAMVRFGMGYAGAAITAGFDFVRGGGSNDTSMNFLTGGGYRGSINNAGQWFVGSGTSATSSAIPFSVTTISGPNQRALEINPTGGTEVYLTAYGANNTLLNTDMVLRAYGNNGGANIIFQNGLSGSASEIGRFDINGFRIGTSNQNGRLTVATSENKNQPATPTVWNTSTQGANDFQLILSRSATGTNGYYGFSSVEQGIAYRTLALQQDGGYVSIGTGTADTGSLLTIQQRADGEGITIKHATRSGYWDWDLSGTTNENYAFQQNNGTSTVVSYLMGRNLHYWNIGGSEAMRINSSSNVVINSTGASGSPLIVGGVTRSMQQGLRNTLAIQVDNTNGAATWVQPNLIGHFWTGTQDGVSIRVPSSGDTTTGSYDLFQDGSHVWYAAGGSNNTGSTATQLGKFQTNGSFQVGVDTVAGTHAFRQTTGSLTQPFSGGLPIIALSSNASGTEGSFWLGDAGSTSYVFQAWYRENSGPVDLQFWNYTTYAGKVSSNAWYQGNNSSSWSTTSDIRLKQNIRPISDALGKIVALNPCHFEYKTQTGKTKTGFIADEFEAVLPGHVHETDPTDEFKHLVGEGEKVKSIDADLLPYLVAAIKELKAEFDAYKLSHP